LLKIPSGLSDDEHRLASDQILAKRLDGLEVSSFGAANGPVWSPDVEWDLEFLRHYPSISTLRIDVKTRSLEPIRSVAGALARLFLAGPPGKNRSIDLEPLMACTHLTSFSCAWPGLDLAPLTRLHGLEELALTGGTQERVAVLSTLATLRIVTLGFGNIESLAGLAKLSRLERFAALRLKPLTDLEPLSDLPALRVLELDTLANVSSLPSLRRTKHLSTVICATMNRLRDLDGLKGSELRELAVINSRVPPASLDRLSLSLPRLKHLVLRLGRARDTEAVTRAFPSTILRESTNSFEEYYRDYIRTDYVAYEPA
jgi:hypothetical protein